MQPLALTPRDIVLAAPDLASPPEVYRRLTEVLEQGDWDLPQLARVVESDPGVTARLLKLVNSPYFGMPRRVSSVADAVGVLGANALRSLVLASTVMERYRGVPEELLDVRAFWRRSLRVAVTASLLAEAAPRAVERQELLLGGLLHDIGGMLLCLTVPEAVREALLEDPDVASSGALERVVLGSPRQALGEALLEHWRLPPRIVAAVAWHPQPAQAPQAALLVALTSLAVAGAAALAEGEGPLTDPADPRWALAGVSPLPAEALAEAADSAYRSTLALFEGTAGAY
ncbi:HDOD domain-containing protein [Spiribacter halobius]|uniref:HDOD domain-containing protein n=1 Tax=Sediminicurvatus halobius TaxID=2182432 RepID=A0A2U2MZM1_9GAMM|nr:HDOD domain-containing protein [Spiribacter halobius]PWG62435.1 hypothetical protein DEM34_12500 [Spiribacter halobius]UEX79538.1 HDOD domain-containing protein [Spiribacter halobius]